MGLVNNACSRFRTAQWLKKSGYLPQVYIFRNLESGQTLYSQLSVYNNRLITKQFDKTGSVNQFNKKPKLRNDLWRLMCFVKMDNHEQCVKLFQDLNRLKYLRGMMKKNYKKFYFSGKFKPLLLQETVADLKESLLHIKDDDVNSFKCDIYWEDLWRMGNKETVWDKELGMINHHAIPKTLDLGRDKSVVLKELCKVKDTSVEKLL